MRHCRQVCQELGAGSSALSGAGGWMCKGGAVVSMGQERRGVTLSPALAKRASSFRWSSSSWPTRRASTWIWLA